MHIFFCQNKIKYSLCLTNKKNYLLFLPNPSYRHFFTSWSTRDSWFMVNFPPKSLQIVSLFSFLFQLNMWFSHIFSFFLYVFMILSLFVLIFCLCSVWFGFSSSVVLIWFRLKYLFWSSANSINNWRHHLVRTWTPYF